ncbi:MAG: LacI family DNA-binding transcriptional regulator [Clostridia bacterium]|nr:LacI family DNA-binding transcriptional regulator [Clostridia bacterium]
MATLRDIAQALNVSISTVSRAVTGKGYVSEELRVKIAETAKRLGYTPNMNFRASRRTTRAVALVLPDISELFFAHITSAVDEVLNNNGYSLMLCITCENPAREDEYIDYLCEGSVDGIIMATVSEKSSRLKKLITSDFPIVFIDNCPQSEVSYDCVICDNSKAGYMATERLISQGHENIGIITGNLEETTGFERLVGYKRALIKHGIEIDKTLIEVGNFTEKSGYACMKRLIEIHKEKMTAIITASGKMTYGAIKAIGDAGLKIPSDIAVMGFDIHDPTGLINPGVTSIIQPEREIGRLAANLIMARIEENKNLPKQRIVLEPSLVLRATC